MNTHPNVRIALLWLLGIVSGTAFAGGGALVAGSLNPAWSSLLVPPLSYLEGSPFPDFLVPGIVLGVGLGGLHLTALVLVAQRRRSAILIVTICGFALLIWIFVQMTMIPFSFLQVIFEVFGLAELGLVLLALGLVHAPARRAH